MSERSAFIRSQKLVKSYQRQLLKIADHVASIINGFTGRLEQTGRLVAALARYAKAIEPWAAAVAARMIAQMDAHDKASWRKISQTLSKGLREELQNADTGALARALINEQATLITSLPLEAAKRVQALAVEAVINGNRSDDIVSAIMKTGQLTKSRAKLIARTEIGRVTTAFSMARATRIGSEGYIWRTAKDKDVRHSHKMMEGQFVAWDRPPHLDGLSGHAGALPNCRCYVEPVIPHS